MDSSLLTLNKSIKMSFFEMPLKFFWFNFQYESINVKESEDQKSENFYPGQCGSVDWPLSHAWRSPYFHSWSGHMSGFQV